MSEKKKEARKQNTVKNLKEEIEILHSIIRTVWSELDLSSVLKSIVNLVQTYTQADSVLLYLFDGEKGQLVLSASAQEHGEAPANIILKLGEGLTGWAAANRQTVFIDEKSYEDPRFKFFPGLDEDTFEAFLSVPLVYRGELVGVLNVQRRNPWKHKNSEIRLIESIATQTAGAIVNARLYTELKAKADSLRAIYDASEAIATERYFDNLLSILISVTAELFNSKVCTFLSFDEERNELVIRAAAGMLEKDLVGKRISLEHTASGKAFITRKPVQLYDLSQAEDKFHKALAENLGLKSMLAVPLVSRGEAIGVLNIFTAYPHAFSAEEVKVVQALANQAGLTIRSMEAEEKINQLEKKLGERKKIEKAKGIIMKEYGMSEEDAYTFIRKQAMDLRKTVGEIAEAIVTFYQLKKD